MIELMRWTLHGQNLKIFETEGNIMIEKLMAFLRSEEGQGLAEYALILVLIAIVAIGALTALGTAITDVLNQIESGLGGS